MKRLYITIVCFTVCLFVAATATAAIKWPAAKTKGQEKLIEYVSIINEDLESLHCSTINSVFEMYTFNAALGITATDNSEIPQNSQISFTLYSDSLNILVYRTCDINSFTAVAGACIHAASPHVTSLEEAMKDPAQYVAKAKSKPQNSFEDTVTELNGPSPRTYYAYYPNQYHDGYNWIQMTLVFPIETADESAIQATAAPIEKTEDVQYEGYQPRDNLTHFEVFTTSTPEPDSPAGMK